MLARLRSLARRSRVPAECREAKPSGTRAGIQRADSQSAIWLPAAIRRVAPRSRVSLRSPGTREIGGARTNRWPCRTHDVKQRSVVRSRGAFVRLGSLFLRVHPNEGWAERRQAHLCLLSRLRDATDPRE